MSHCCLVLLSGAVRIQQARINKPVATTLVTTSPVRICLAHYFHCLKTIVNVRQLYLHTMLLYLYNTNYTKGKKEQNMADLSVRGTPSFYYLCCIFQKDL